LLFDSLKLNMCFSKSLSRELSELSVSKVVGVVTDYVNSERTRSREVPESDLRHFERGILGNLGVQLDHR